MESNKKKLNKPILSMTDDECKRDIKVGKHADICIELNRLYEKKNRDYGDSFSKSFDEFGLTMSAIRLDDKMRRLKSLIRNGDLSVKDESIIDTLKDLANYSIMTIMELEKEVKDNE